jgi:hypothetical protein
VGTASVFVPTGLVELELPETLEIRYLDVGTASVAVLLDVDCELEPLGMTLKPGYPEVGTASVAVLLGAEDEM